MQIRGAHFGLPGFDLSRDAGAPVYLALNGAQLARDWQACTALSYVF